MNRIAVKAIGLTKTYIGGVTALDDVSLELEAGKVYGLVGPNGAGKSTLTNIIAGYIMPDKGEVYVNGVKIEDFHQAMIEAGVVRVEQHPNLAPALTPLEHLALLFPTIFFDLDSLRGEAESIVKELGVRVDLDQHVEKLSISQQRIFEIIRALILCKILHESGKKPVLILDESTAYLPIQQKDSLKKYLRKLIDLEYTIIIISHDLSEILDVSDEVLIMSGGKIVSRMSSRGADFSDLMKKMFEEVPLIEFEAKRKDLPPPSDEALKIEDLSVRDDRGELVVKNLNLTVMRGEIHGVATIPGTGEKELAECIYGIRPPEKGKVILFGEDVTGKSTQELRKRGVGFLSDDRIADGLIPNASIEDNLTIGSEIYFAHKLMLNPKKRREIAEKLVKEFSIVLKRLGDPIETLSGGNMQRAYIGRVLGRWDKLLIALHPTVGLDPRGVKLFFDKVMERKRRGLTTIIFSPNIKELLSTCDRVSAFVNGKIVGTYRPSEIDVEKLGMIISGLMVNCSS